MAAANSTEFLKDFMFGGVSAAVAKTATAPIERVKLIIQNQASMKNVTPGKEYKGIADCFVRVSREEGVAALWRGNLANIIRYFPTQALNFAFKERYKALTSALLGKPNPKTEFTKWFISNLLSGGLAGTTSLMFVYPLDFARTRLGTDMGKSKAERQFNGMFDCISKIAKSDGIGGLYRGFVISALGIFFYRAAYFGLYDSSKNFTGNNPNILIKFIVAQIVVSLSGLISYPLDTVRRRLMMQSGKKGGEVQYTGTFDAFAKILAKEGPGGFFKGALSNIFRGVGASLVLVLYDELRRFFDPNAKASSE
jgi:solute carrier family 25 (adenine nucleotide translocator) protein 4/5/6/31